MGTFTDVSVSYTALAGDSGNLRVRLSHNGSGTVTEFDNVRLTSGTTLPVDPVTVSFPPSRYMVQRTAAGTGDIAISGTYTGGAPGRIEARAVVSSGGGNSGTGSNWQVIDAAPSAGSLFRDA